MKQKEVEGGGTHCALILEAERNAIDQANQHHHPDSPPASTCVPATTRWPAEALRQAPSKIFRSLFPETPSPFFIVPTAATPSLHLQGSPVLKQGGAGTSNGHQSQG